jgi:hypothetical protein
MECSFFRPPPVPGLVHGNDPEQVSFRPLGPGEQPGDCYEVQEEKGCGHQNNFPPMTSFEAAINSIVAKKSPEMARHSSRVTISISHRGPAPSS